MKIYQIENSLVNADKLEFWNEIEHNQPPLILLVFKNDEDISKSKANVAYNELFKIVSNESSFIKITTVNSFATFSIIDATTDLHLTFKNIKFNSEQLYKFISEVRSQNKVALMLSKYSSTERPTIVQTSDDFDIITLAGII